MPREVSGVRFRSPALFEWNSAAARSGTGARTLTDDTNPARGSGFYYLIRASCDGPTMGLAFRF